MMPPVTVPAPHRLMIVAAGTGGHVMPGLAVAQALQARGWVVAWLGTRAGMERTLVERAGLPFHAIAFSNIRGKGVLAFAGGVLRLARAFVASLRILRRSAPHVVFTTGGYVAVPAGLAAACLRQPLSFLNADAAPQLSLRILLHLVRVVLCGFEGAAARMAGTKARVSGAPVRAEIAALPEPSVRYAGRTGRLTLLVVGGNFTFAGNIPANNIAAWNGSSWSALGGGMNGLVVALTVFNGNLIAGGLFTTAGGTACINIAQWNGISWSA
jgi:UDP-N-acetylglucosamine--N-acetylmuramyl-(pentapeptide) pyrophosphoryl-undecaprenol N-acetylglucosamine transferase